MAPSLTIFAHRKFLNQDVIKENPAIADGVFFSKELKSDIYPVYLLNHWIGTLALLKFFWIFGLSKMVRF